MEMEHWRDKDRGDTCEGFTAQQQVAVAATSVGHTQHRSLDLSPRTCSFPSAFLVCKEKDRKHAGLLLRSFSTLTQLMTQTQGRVSPLFKSGQPSPPPPPQTCPQANFELDSSSLRLFPGR